MEQRKFKKLSSDKTECYRRENVGSRYCSSCREYFAKLLDDGEKYAKFVVCQYDVRTVTLSVLAPQEKGAEVASLCDMIVNRALEEDVSREVTIDLFDGSVRLAFSAGFNIKEIEAKEWQLRSVHFLNPPVKTSEELLQWVCKMTECEVSDVEWHALKTSYNVRRQKDSSTVGIVAFQEEKFAKKARKNCRTSSPESGCHRTIVKSSVDNLKEMLNEHDVFPFKLVNIRPNRCLIVYSNAPESVDEERLRKLLRQHGIPDPTYVRCSRPVNGTRYINVTFIVDKEVEDIVAKCKKISQLRAKFQITVPCRRGYVDAAPPTREISVRTKCEETLNPAEYLVLFRHCQEADVLYKLGRRNRLFHVDGSATVKVPHPEVISLEDVLDGIASVHGVECTMGKMLPEGGREVRFNGNLTSVCEEAAQEFMNVIAPMKYDFEAGDTLLMAEELRAKGHIHRWAAKASVVVDEHSSGGSFSGISIHGDKYQQGLFLGRLARYYDEFEDRYHLLFLSADENCWFRKGKSGQGQLRRLVEDQKLDEARISYRASSSAIEIAVKSNTRRLPSVIIGECVSAIGSFLAQLHQQSFLAENCVYCNGRPDSNLSICGHPHCEECLHQAVVTQLPTYSVDECVTPAESRTLERRMRSVLGSCPRCQTSISAEDLQRCLMGSALEEVCSAFARLYLSGADRPLGLCPKFRCSAIMAKRNGYTDCPSCEEPCCPECGIDNDDRHRGVSCEEYPRLLRKGTSGIELLKSIVTKAEEYARSHWRANAGKKKIRQIEVNPGLERGCAALQRYCAGIERVGFAQFLHKAVFAWYGTHHDDVPTICDDGFDPKRRWYFRTGGNTEELSIANVLPVVSGKEKLT